MHPYFIVPISMITRVYLQNISPCDSVKIKNEILSQAR